MSRASDRAYVIIRGIILSGEVPPGAQLSEEALAERCAVSRTPVRDALRRLESELLIRRSESQRSFVAEWSMDDIKDVFELRAMLEGEAVRRAASRISADQIKAMQAHNSAIGTAINTIPTDVATFLEHNRAFHEIILTAAGSPRLANLLSGLVEQPVVRRTALNYDRENLLRSWSEHAEILGAFFRRDGDWAASIMAGHLRRAYYSFIEARQNQREVAK